VKVLAGAGATLAGLVGDRATLQEEATSLGALVHKSLGPHRGQVEKGPILEKGSFVGRNATIIGNVHVGEFSYVAAGTVVTRDIPSGILIKGDPGRTVKKLENRGARNV
jgi:acetyltransferase-like isoleucine patch superfamily enzyme